MKSHIIRSIAMVMLVVLALPTQAQIRNSKHDLSSSSTTTGPKSTSSNEVCVFCHTPHSQAATTLLWNRTASSATYTVYSSSSMEQVVGQPGSSSKNCLSCHDGTVAFNSLLNNPGSGVGTAPTMSKSAISGWDSLSTNLSNDHPVGFVYTTSQALDAELRAAALVNSKPTVSFGGVTLPLDGTTTANGKVECISCHDPHKTSTGTFLHAANTASQLCLTCHIK